jgi:hypothetical protein
MNPKHSDCLGIYKSNLFNIYIYFRSGHKVFRPWAQKVLIGSLFYIFFIIEKNIFEEKRGKDIEKFPPNFVTLILS